jgi:CRP-like cAMP-binding protein
LSSYITGETSIFNIEALEDSQLLLLSKSSWEALMQRIPKFERYFRIIIQNHLITTQKRIMQSHTKTSEEMYLKFVQTYPESIQRIPQHMIASYLGISRETLSRVRKRLVSHR